MSVFLILQPVKYAFEAYFGCFCSNPIFSTKPPGNLFLGGFCFFATLFATFLAKKYRMKKAPGQSYVLAKLRDCKGNLSARWYVEYQVFNRETGKMMKRREYCPGKYETEKQRRTWARDVIKEIDDLLQSGHVFDPSADTEQEPETPPEQLTIQQLVSKSLAHKKLVLKKKSHTSYSGTLNRFLEWLGSTAMQPVESLKQRNISDYQDYLLGKGLGTVTVNNNINQIVTVFKHLEKRGEIEKKPVSFNKLPTTEEYRNVAFSQAHREKMDTIMSDSFPNLYLFTRVMYYQFIRPGEMLGLKVRDVNLERNTITVRGGNAKGRKMDTLPLHPLLREHLIYIKDYPGTFYIFGKHLGTGQHPAGENTAYNTHADALEAAGLTQEDYTLYSWKHAGVTAAYLAGTDLVRLQWLLRHKSIETTMIYLKSLQLQFENFELKNW